MPICPQCGGNIDCPGHAHVVGRNMATCALKKGALWIQVVDEKGNGVEGVDVTLDGGNGKKTDPQGLAAYDPLDDGVEYAVEVSDTLPGSVTPTHKPPQVRTARADVEKGKIAYVKFQLVLKQPKLEVVPTYKFADVVVGLSAVHGLAVKNIGEAELHITGLTYPTHFPESPGSLLKSGAKLKPGDTLELEASFKPDLDGDLTGDLFIDSNDPIAARTKVVLEGKAIPPWKLSVAVESDKRAKVGAVEAAWVEGDVEVGISAVDADHKNPVKLVTKALTQVDEGKTTAAAMYTGTARATVYVWARAKSGAWFSRADVPITLDPGETKTATVQMLALKATATLFRGNKALAVVPFSTTDVFGVLDAALEDGDQGVDVGGRPGKYDAAFTFPLATEFGDVTDANADTALWRVRVKLDAVPEVVAPVDVKSTLKVLTKSGKCVNDVSFGNDKILSGRACHEDGMKVALAAAKADEWVSPYCRVVTTTDKKDQACVSVHSLGPIDKTNAYPDDTTLVAADVMDAGKQYGRKLRIEGTLYGAPYFAELVMGGDEPYARVPVKMLFASSDGTDITNKQKRVARIKLHQLNAWWAGQGIEFVFVDPAVPLAQIVAPPRRLVTVGEHTGPAVVSTVDFQIALEVTITATGKGPQEETITIDVPKDLTPAGTAAVIKRVVEAWRPVHVDNVGITLGTKVHDLGGPRAFLKGAAFPGKATLPLLGTKGPVDIVLSVAGGAVDALEISGLAVTPDDQSIDIHAPPVARPYHEAVFSPPAATTRQWVRAFGGGNGNYVAVIIEGKGHGYYGPGQGYPKSLCEPGFASQAAAGVHRVMELALAPPQNVQTIDNAESKSRALTLLNFGRWGEPCAMFTLFLDLAGSFQRGPDDLQHEIGHVLSDLDHTIGSPDWFYKSELLHNGSAQPANALKITKHKIHVSYIEDDGGTWKFAFTELAAGYGGAVRAFIDTNRNGWVVNAGWNGWS